MSRIITSIGIKGYKVLNQTTKGDSLEIDLQARSKRPKACIRCGSRSLQSKGHYLRNVRHLESFGRSARLKIRCRRFRCKSCVRSFVEPLPGVLPGRHSSEPFRENIYTLHHEGIPSSVMGRFKKLASATVCRIYAQFTARKANERLSLDCPVVLGIDEHTLHKKKQFATTFCDLGKRRIFDIVQGKAATDLEGFLSQLNGREKVKMVCIDLCSAFRSLVRRYFPNAILVADRFHVVRLVLHHFIQLARNLAPAAFLRRGIGGLLRKEPKRLTSSERDRLEMVLKTIRCSGLSMRRCTTSAACSIKSTRRQHGPNTSSSNCFRTSKSTERRRTLRCKPSQRRFRVGDVKSPPYGASPKATASPRASIEK